MGIISLFRPITRARNASVRLYHVLGIETSCDDTGVAIVNQDAHVLSNCLHSQQKLHLSHGGIIPMVAKQEHLLNMDPVARRAFEESKLASVAEDIDAIAVTTRPSMTYSLQIGLNYAKMLATKYSKPLIPVHHMQAHALMPLMNNRDIKFPFITLLLSGGHCLLAVVKRFDDFHILGTSLDEAPGDTLDKFARRQRLKSLGAPFDSISGGAAVELLAQMPTSDKFKYFHGKRSVPMLEYDGCDFSFSGFHICWDRIQPEIDRLWATGDREAYITEMGHISASLQRVMFCQIIRKLYRAIKYYRMFWRYDNEDAFVEPSMHENQICTHLGYGIRLKPNTCTTEQEENELDIVISGGVAANKYFVETIGEVCRELIDPAIRIYTPERNLCNDNGLMIAWNGLLHYKQHLDSPNSVGVIVNEPSEFDQIQAEAESLMGQDIRHLVANRKFKLPKLGHNDCRVYESRPTSNEW